MIISRIGIGSLAKVAASRWIAPRFGAGAVIILPLLYGTLGAVALSLVAMLYNLVARTVGGVQIEVDRPL